MAKEMLSIIINQAPYIGERAWNGLRLAITALSKNMDVNIFLMEDGVYVARKGQKPPADTPNLEQLVERFIKMGGKVKLCGTCVNARGFEPESEEFGVCFIGKKESGLTIADFIDGVQMGSMMELVDWIKESQKVVSF